MATIREKRPGYWEVREFVGRDASGRPIQVSRPVRGTKKDALAVAAALRVSPTSREGASVTVAAMLDLWVAQHEATWAPSSLANQMSRVRLVKRDPIARTRIVQLTAVEVDLWHERLARRGVGEGSIRNQHVVIRASMNLAARWGWVKGNVVALATLGRRKAQPRGSLSVLEVQRVLDAAGLLVAEGELEPFAAAALRLAAVTGARRSELAALRWDDFAGRQLTIDSSISIIRSTEGRRVRAPELRDGPTKTANHRTVTLDETTAGAIRALPRLAEEPGPWLLSINERPVNPERVSCWWRRARDAAGVERCWRLHDLRHWSATMSIAAGHDVRTVANRLGHANPAMTLRVYAHAVDAADAPVAETLGRALDARDQPSVLGEPQ
jgi:integrase